MQKQKINHSYTHVSEISSQGYKLLSALVFLALLTLLVLVFFVLPQRAAPSISLEELAQQQQTQDDNKAIKESPYQDALLAQQRSQAQQVLSEFMDVQQKLNRKQVTRWADEQYQQALVTAASGDELYQAREFKQAQQRYQQGLQQLKQLEQQLEQVFQQKIQQGKRAIAQQQPEVAIESYQIANAIKPADIAAQQGLARASNQPQLLRLLQQAQYQLKIKQPETAAALFQQALDLDQQSQAAQQGLAQTRAQLTQREYQTQMSQGYRALQQKNTQWQSQLSNKHNDCYRTLARQKRH